MNIRTRYISYLVLVVMGVLFLRGAAQASAATMSVTTDATTFASGDTLTVDLKIGSDTTGVNAAQGTVKFPADVLSVDHVDKTNSIFNFWLREPSFSNDAGTVTFIGASTAGVSGKTLQVLRIVFKIKGTGQASITLTDAAVTASDGSGTNILTSTKALQFTSVQQSAVTVIAPPQITRPAAPAAQAPSRPVITVSLYPDPSGWSSAETPFLASWPIPADITDVSTALNKEPSFSPTRSEGLFDNKTFPQLSDGVWYLHVRFKNAVGWGLTTHYRIGIDTIPPLPFEVHVKEGVSTDVITPTIEFSTDDQPSGIALYRILVDKVEAGTTSENSFKLPALTSGDHSIVVRAIDKAGNVTEGTVTIHINEVPFLVIGGIKITQFVFFIILIIVLIAGTAIGWYLSVLERQQRQRRIVIAQRDITTGFSVIDQEIAKILERYRDGKIDEREAQEIKRMLVRMREATEKMEHYIGQNIEEIEG